MYKLVELSKLCNIQIGKTPDRKTETYWGKGYPWVTISDLKEKTVCKTKEQITQKAVEEKNCRLVKKGTLLMSFKLSIGKLAFTDCDLYTNEAIAALNIKEDVELSKDYLYYALKFVPLLNDAKIAVKGKTLNQKTLAKIKIPLPNTIEEQKKIANLLSQIEILILKREKTIELLDKLVKSTFLDIFGDPITNSQNRPIDLFENVVKLQRGYDLPKKDREENGDFNVYGSNGILTNHNEYRCEYGIVTGRSGTIGEVYYSEKPFWPLNTTLFSINTFGNNLIYLTYLVKFFKLNRFVRGAGVPTLNRNIVHKEKIYVVDKDLQDKFSNIVKKIETTKKTYQKSLDELNQLFASVSQKAFKGELDLNSLEELIDVKPELLETSPSYDKSEVSTLYIKNKPSSSKAEKILQESSIHAFTEIGKEEYIHTLTIEDDKYFQKILKELLEKESTFTELYKLFTDKYGFDIPYDEDQNKNEKPFTFKDTIFQLLKEEKLFQIFDRETKQILLGVKKCDLSV
ncbi:restriction endonuclease subunit S [Arcobacter sp. LA11]|uniref:restriction endonuclease subunit S n=1 Tax=Arcobacter sp. LA11 TaxID=1898176 RepID=UPI00093401E1|nr:restriction endonuclease subunit S [Arcobacter sp. LA11]